MGRGGAPLKKELDDITYLESHPEICQMFRDAGCYRYVQKLQGYHQGVTEAFAKTFDGAKVIIGPLEMQIDEAGIVAATKMSGQGERWFKTTITKNIEFRSYLKPEFQSIIWKRDVPTSHLEKKWQDLLKAIQVYITISGEGRYDRVMLYHFKLMNHFIGKTPLNLPYYLHRSLTKMSHKVQAEPEKIHNTLFHYGLIKLIVLEELRRRERTWEHLLFWGGFEPEVHPENKKKTSKRKSSTPQSNNKRRRAITPIQTEEPTSTSKHKKAKKKLDFSEVPEDQGHAKQTNILNLPYLDSESEPGEEEIPVYQDIEPAMEDTQETAAIPSLDKPKSSTRKKTSKSMKIQRLKDKIAEYEVLERVIKSRYETLTHTAAETRSAFERLRLVHVKEKRRKKRVIRQNYKLAKRVRFPSIKIKLLTTKPTTRSYLEVLAEAAENLHEDSSR